MLSRSIVRLTAALACIAATGCVRYVTPGVAPGPYAAYESSRPSEILNFAYGWPAAVAAEPSLVARLRGEMERAFNGAMEDARRDRAARGAAVPFNAHSYRQMWRLSGESGRLLVVDSAVERYAGGAHGALDYETLIYDRRHRRSWSFDDLFSSGRSPAMVRDRGCALLDRERAKRRGGERPRDGSDSLFWDCPAAAALNPIPADSDRNGRFDRITLLIAPYSAGPWAEGSYLIDVPVDRALIAALRPAYRSSFEVR